MPSMCGFSAASSSVKVASLSAVACAKRGVIIAYLWQTLSSGIALEGNVTFQRHMTRDQPDANCTTTAADDVTRILASVEEDGRAASELLPIVYEELRNLARSRMARESGEQTLQATALVHEAYLKLVKNGDPAWENKAHFFGAAAEAMRRILIDRARKKKSEKHGGEMKRVQLEGLDLSGELEDEQLLELNEVLERFEKKDAEAAQLVKLRFFAGLSLRDVAKVMGMSERTSHRVWAYARTWLFAELNRE